MLTTSNRHHEYKSWTILLFSLYILPQVTNLLVVMALFVSLVSFNMDGGDTPLAAAEE
jgi:uncharacterized membrane protein